jgi:K+-transporting ATPase KdpF subunit
MRIYLWSALCKPNFLIAHAMRSTGNARFNQERTMSGIEVIYSLSQIAALLLFVYLGYALIRPEKF